MKYMWITGALAVACLLMMPAISMPDQDDGKKIDTKFEAEQAMCMKHQICLHGQELKGPMGDDGKQQGCPCAGMDGGQKFGPESKNDDKGSCQKSIKSMMEGNRWNGNEFCHKNVKSMMDGECQCQGPKMGEDGKPQMTQCQNKEWGQKEPMGEDGRPQMTQCQNKEWGEKLGPKSMMDGNVRDNKSLCHKPIKSMMGDEGKGDGKGEKEQIAILMLISR
jgi:hypothetical protein